jgi:GAF domain-containing protein
VMAEPDSGPISSPRPSEEDGHDFVLVDPPEERAETGFGPSKTVRAEDLTRRQSVDEGGATGGDDDGVWKLAAALSGAMAPLDVAAALAEEGAAAAAASFSNMALLDNLTSRVRLVHHPVMHESIAARWSEFELSEPTPLCEAMLTGRPVLLESIEEVSRAFPNMAADTAAADLSATASLPLSSASGVVLGAAGFGWPDTQEFGADQVRRLDLIANLAAQALERALLYEAERAASVRRERADAQLIQDAFLPRAMPANSGLEVAAVYLRGE